MTEDAQDRTDELAREIMERAAEAAQRDRLARQRPGSRGR